MTITDAASFYSYCRTGDNVWSQPVCAGNSYGNSIGQLKIAYCRSNPTDSRCTNYCTSQDAAKDGVQSLCSSVYADPSSGYCSQGQNFNSPACQNICTASTGTDPWGYKGNCNQVYANACALDQYKDLDICACSRPWSSYPGSSVISQIIGAPQKPICYFAECISKGYKDGGDVQCPKCVQGQNISIAGSDNSVSDAVQGCPGITPAAKTADSSVAADTTTAAFAPNIVIAGGSGALGIVGFLLGAVI